MKKSLCMVLAAVFMSFNSLAEDTGPVFSGIPWGSSSTKVISELKKANFTSDCNWAFDEDGDIKFIGNIMGYPSVNYALFVNDKLLKMSIKLITKDEVVFAAYEEASKVLVSKYGQPTKKYAFFSSPYYSGDGYEEQAVRLGKGHFIAFWGTMLSVSITDKLIVEISYESSGWKAESDARKAKSASAL